MRAERPRETPEMDTRRTRHSAIQETAPELAPEATADIHGRQSIGQGPRKYKVSEGVPQPTGRGARKGDRVIQDGPGN